MSGRYWCSVAGCGRPEPEVLPGDVFHSASDRWLGRAIRWAGREPGEHALVNHTGLVVEGAASIHDAVVIEAVGKIRKVRLGDVYRPEERVTVWRPLNIPEEDIDLIIAAAENDLGKAYPWWQLGLHLGDAAIGEAWQLVGGSGRPVLLRRLAGVSGLYVCSASLGVWHAAAGYTFGSANPAALSPDDIHDRQRATAGRHWAEIRSLSPLGATT